MTIAAETHPGIIGDEAELVARAKARDAGVWAAWHDRYYILIYKYAASRLQNPEEAEDVASQVFLEALKSIDRYSYRGKPILAWFYGIAHHVVSRRHRHRGRTIELENAETISVDGFEESSVSSIVVRAALNALKPQHREVLVLRFVLELPTREVARILGRTEASTYSLQVRAVGALRNQLDRHSYTSAA